MTYEMAEALESLLNLLERKALPIGTTRTWKGGDYIKTDKGWRKVAVGRKAAKGSDATSASTHAAPSTKSVAAFVAKAADNYDYESYDASEVKKRLDAGDEDLALMRAAGDLEATYAMSHWKTMNKQAKEVESDLKSVFGENPKVQGFIHNVRGMFSQEWSGWQSLGDTERRMNDVLKAAESIPNDKQSLKKAGVSSEQAQKVAALLKSHADRVMGRITTARAAAEKNAKKIVAKMKQGT